MCRRGLARAERCQLSSEPPDRVRRSSVGRTPECCKPDCVRAAAACAAGAASSAAAAAAAAMADGAEQTALQAAAQAVLNRNAHIVLTLEGLSKLRAGAPPSDAERTLFAELRDNLVALAGLLPPRLVLPAEQPPMQTFLATSRAMGLLPLPADFRAPPVADTGGGGEEGGAEEAAAANEPQQAPRAPVRRLAPGERAKLRRRLPGPPKGFTGREFHGLNSLERVEFYEEAVVLDLDEAGHATKEPFVFSLREPWHGISFAIGEGEDGSPLLSYSVVHAFYMLPDGTKWAEHTDLCDVDDLRAAGKRAKLPFRQLTEDLRDRELLAGTGRKHSNLDDAEYNFHVFSKLDFDRRALAGTLPPEAYFVRNCFDPAFMRLLGPWSLPPPLGST